MLLEECERDHRLLTLADEQITLNSLSARLLKAGKDYNDDTASKESKKLECYLNRVHWQQVCIRFSLCCCHFVNSVFFRMVHILYEIFISMLIQVILFVLLDQLELEKSLSLSLTFIFIIFCCLEFTFAITLR